MEPCDKQTMASRTLALSRRIPRERCSPYVDTASNTIPLEFHSSKSEKNSVVFRLSFAQQKENKSKKKSSRNAGKVLMLAK